VTSPRPQGSDTGGGALPNLVIIGAGKSGTTSLHRYLDLHPDVSMSRRKELQFFTREHWRDQVDWYRAQFETSAAVRGESSPTYSVNPTLGDVPARMHALIPDARLLYIVRDPVERLLAHWVEWVHVTYERRSLGESLADYASPLNPYVAASRYSHQLDWFCARYDERQILVLDQHELLERRAETLDQVFAFLDLPALPDRAGIDALHNVREQKLWLNGAGLWLVDRGAGQRLGRAARRLPGPLRRAVKRTFARPVEKPELDPVLRAELEAFLHEDAERLRARTGRAFAHWSV
jgi:hypothetical protein